MNNYDMEAIGVFIASRRKKKGLTQNQLAVMLHASPKTVSKWETGHSFPDLIYQLDLCHILNITLDELHRGCLNKRKRRLKAIICILLPSLIFLFLLLTPVFLYLLSYYGKSYNSFNVYSVYGYDDTNLVIKGEYIEYYKYNLLIINDISDNTLKKNDIYYLNVYYNENLILSSSDPDTNKIIIKDKFDTNGKWSFKIIVNDIVICNGELLIINEKNSTEKYAKTKSKIDTQHIKDLLLKRGFKLEPDDVLIKNADSQTIVKYYINDYRFFYKYVDGKVYQTCIYYLDSDIADCYSYYNGRKSPVIIEKFKYNFNNNSLECITMECVNDFIINRIRPYRNLLMGE